LDEWGGFDRERPPPTDLSPPSDSACCASRYRNDPAPPGPRTGSVTWPMSDAATCRPAARWRGGAEGQGVAGGLGKPAPGHLQPCGARDSGAAALRGKRGDPTDQESRSWVTEPQLV